MFKCCECGETFDKKPDYCDCGNNVFEEIIENIPETFNEKQTQEIIAPPSVELKQVKQFKKPDIEWISLIIFILCIILSIFAIIFIDIPQKEDQSPIKQETKINEEIPEINNLWNNTPAKQEQTPVTQPVTQVDVKPILSQHVSPKAISTPIKKQANVKTSTNNAPQIKKTTPKAVTSTKKVSNPQEFINYKVKLRNKIASRINFAGILGDGSCAITFRIDKNGNLINRAFSKKSENEILNNAVYEAMLSVPNFTPPPASYNGSTLKLSVSFFNGSFEVSLN